MEKYKGFTPVIADMFLGDTLDVRVLGRTPVAAFLATLMVEEVLSPSNVTNAAVLTYEQLREHAKTSNVAPLQHIDSNLSTLFQDVSIGRSTVIHSTWSNNCGRSRASVCFSWADIIHPEDQGKFSPRQMRLSRLSMLSLEEMQAIRLGEYEYIARPPVFPEVWGRDIRSLGTETDKSTGLALFYQNRGSQLPYTLILGNYTPGNKPVPVPMTLHPGSWQTPLRTGFRKLMINGKG